MADMGVYRCNKRERDEYDVRIRELEATVQRVEAVHQDTMRQWAEDKTEIKRLRGLVKQAFREGHAYGIERANWAQELNEMSDHVAWCESEVRKELEGNGDG